MGSSRGAVTLSQGVLGTKRGGFPTSCGEGEEAVPLRALRWLFLVGRVALCVALLVGFSRSP